MSKKEPIKYTSYKPGAGWNLSGLGIRSTGGKALDRLSVVMTGAGLGMAALPGSPSWSDLVLGVADDLKVKITRTDPRLDAMTVSWNRSRRKVSAQPSEFQNKVAAFLKKAHMPYKQPNGRASDAQLKKAFKEFLKCVQCDVIIDLNYDSLVEDILTDAKVDFYRIIGAQLDIHAPLPQDTIVLWKVHGSVDHPSTIVLSPTEYQRIYEVNDLGSELARLGAKAHTIWTVGVGLAEDDVWRYLTSRAKDLDIVSFWLTEYSATTQDKAKLGEWHEGLGEGVAHVTMLNAPYRTQKYALRESLEQYVQKSQSTRISSRASSQLESTLSRFDASWKSALEAGTPRRHVVDHYFQEYSDLVHFMLTRSKKSGPRWLHFLDPSKPVAPKAVGAEFFAIVDNALNLMAKFAGADPNRGLLLRNCVQTIVRNVFDWLEAFDIEHELKLDPPGISEVARDASVLVGANPFDPDVRGDGVTFNLNHVFDVADELYIGSPLSDGPIGASVKATHELLSEDEWECIVQSLYYHGNPRLKIGRNTIDLKSVPAVFPWGFGRRGQADFRANTPGTVTQAWHLVSDRDALGRQICKGGSLRDRGDRAFMIGRRGLIRIGEFDDFVQHTVVYKLPEPP